MNLQELTNLDVSCEELNNDYDSLYVGDIQCISHYTDLMVLLRRTPFSTHPINAKQNTTD